MLNPMLLGTHVKSECGRDGDGLLRRDDQIAEFELRHIDACQIAATDVALSQLCAAQQRAGEVAIAKRRTPAIGGGEIDLAHLYVFHSGRVEVGTAQRAVRPVATFDAHDVKRASLERAANHFTVGKARFEKGATAKGAVHERCVGMRRAVELCLSKRTFGEHDPAQRRFGQIEIRKGDAGVLIAFYDLPGPVGVRYRFGYHKRSV